MPKQKPEFSIRSFGIYHHWDAKSKDLPDIAAFTTQVPAQLDIEFGFIINIKGAKNKLLHYCIEHPGIHDDQGKVRPPFEGDEYVKSNDWDFYLGDTIWEPIQDKLGAWKLWLSLDEKRIAEKTFELVPPAA